MFETKPTASKELQSLMDRLVLTGLGLTSLAVVLAVLLGAG